MTTAPDCTGQRTNAPDGVEEMRRQREERKAKRRGRQTRTVPAPQHPRRDAPGDPQGTGASENVPQPEPAAPETPEAPEEEPGQPRPTDEPKVDAEPQDPPSPEDPEKVTSAPKSARRYLNAAEAVSVPSAAAGTAKKATDAALSWAAAARKQTQRLEGLAEAVLQARADGVPVLVLVAALADAEHRAGASLPAEIWMAAGASEP